MSKEGFVVVDGLLAAGIRAVRQVPIGGFYDAVIVALSVWFQFVVGVLRLIVAVARSWLVYPLLFTMLLYVLYFYWLMYDADFEDARWETIARLSQLPRFSGCIGSKPMTYARDFLEDLVDEEHRRQDKMCGWEYFNAPSPRDVVIDQVRQRRPGTHADVLDDYLEERKKFFKTRPWWQRHTNGW